MAREKAISDEQIIAALITNGTIAKAAKQVGISPRAIYDRMSSSEFKRSYEQAKTDLVRNAVFQMNIKLIEAIDVIAELMKDPATPPATRLQAAQTILNNSIKYFESLNCAEQRIKSDFSLWL